MEPRQAYSEADLLSAGATICYIYTLHASNDPTCRPRYVGFTINPRGRVASHNVGKECGRKARWVRELKRVGARAILSVIHTFRSDDFSERGIVEATWIESYRQKFPDLLNDMGGGGGLTKCSESVRANMSASAKKRCADPEYRAKVSAKTKDVWRDPNARERMSAANKRSWEDIETRANRVAASKLRWKDPKEREKKSAELKKYCANPDVRAKMSNAFKRGWDNPTARERMSAENKRRWADPEYRKKMSASFKRRWTRQKLEKELDEY